MLCPVLRIFVGPVHPSDGLKQDMVPHRLIEVHGVQDWSVESSEELLGDDENLRQAVRLPECLANLQLLRLVVVKPAKLCEVIVAMADDHLGVLGWQVTI